MPSKYPDTLEAPGSVTACLQPVLDEGCASSAVGSPFLATPNATSVEDCLFLDLYAPISVVGNNTANVPVIVWIYGGAFIIGSKDAAETNFPLYDGTGPIQAAQSMNESVIFVTGNYRLGPLGWLAGTAMNAATKANTATTNAGLTDQFLLFQWVQDHIQGFGGDVSRVNAWGESAGGSSIIHHLIAQLNGSLRPPQFKRAVIQSAAFQWLWDTAEMDNVFKDFSTICGCAQSTDQVGCLQNVTEADMTSYIQTWYENIKGKGPFNIGPVVDGSIITQLPVLALENGMSQCKPSLQWALINFRKFLSDRIRHHVPRRKRSRLIRPKERYRRVAPTTVHSKR